MLKTFSIGGVHPHENKLSAHQPIVQAEIPAKAVILLSQHIGAPAKPIVAKGDVVKVGIRSEKLYFHSSFSDWSYPFE